MSLEPMFFQRRREPLRALLVLRGEDLVVLGIQRLSDALLVGHLGFGVLLEEGLRDHYTERLTRDLAIHVGVLLVDVTVAVDQHELSDAQEADEEGDEESCLLVLHGVSLGGSSY